MAAAMASDSIPGCICEFTLDGYRSPPRLRIVLAVAVQPAQVAISAPPRPRSSTLLPAPRCELGRRRHRRKAHLHGPSAAACRSICMEAHAGGVKRMPVELQPRDSWAWAIPEAVGNVGPAGRMHPDGSHLDTALVQNRIRWHAKFHFCP